MTATENGKGRYAQRRARGRRPASMEFPEDLYDDLKAQAKIEDRSMAAIVRQASSEYILKAKQRRRKPRKAATKRRGRVWSGAGD